MAKQERYFVTYPAPDGYAYYDVRDRSSDQGKNFSVATFSKHLEHAEREALSLCAVLNYRVTPSTERAAQEQGSPVPDPSCATGTQTIDRRIGVFNDESLMNCLKNNFFLVFGEAGRDPQDMIQLMAAEIQNLRRNQSQ